MFLSIFARLSEFFCIIFAFFFRGQIPWQGIGSFVVQKSLRIDGDRTAYRHVAVHGEQLLLGHDTFGTVLEKSNYAF